MPDLIPNAYETHTFDEWRSLGYQVQQGERHVCRDASGRPVFNATQVRPRNTAPPNPRGFRPITRRRSSTATDTAESPTATPVWDRDLLLDTTLAEMRQRQQYFREISSDTHYMRYDDVRMAYLSNDTFSFSGESMPNISIPAPSQFFAADAAQESPRQALLEGRQYFSQLPVGALFRDESGNFWRKTHISANEGSLRRREAANTVLMTAVNSAPIGQLGNFVGHQICEWPLPPRIENDVRQKVLEHIKQAMELLGIGETAP